ncbi:MAG: TolC family protein [Rhodocyclaceae bacterium]|nr:TolC family protein [Rhodocyclaceae bacterium]
MRRLLAAGMLAVACLAQGAEVADLPPQETVLEALRVHPQVQAALAGLRAAQAQRDGLLAGPHEFTLRAMAQSRKDRSIDQRYREHEIGIERSLRLPGKVALDADLGTAGLEVARHALGEALHAVSRELLARWFAWQREAAAVTDWQAQVAIWRELETAVRKKVGAGETARLEAMLIDAQLKQAEAQLAQAQARRERAAREWRQHFPGIGLPDAPRLAEPQPIDASPDAIARWRARILAEHHELAVARSEARRSRLAAARAEAERRPDPTVGLTLGSERDGQERLLGVHLSIPLPGEARTAGARAASAEADAAAARESLALARAEAEASQAVAAAADGFTQWRRHAEVARQMEENARLVEKAWRLGEGQYAELQAARRQAIEARLAASLALLEANEARYRLLLDAHELWDFESIGSDADKRDLSQR